MRSMIKRVSGGLASVVGAVLLRPGTCTRKLVGHRLADAGREVRLATGRLHGVGYRLRGAHPDPDVIDNVLADRIRSKLGGVEKRLDLPHVHVMVENHVALLHGEVSTEAEAAEIERVVGAVSGVAGVESHLHIGLASGDTRPSAGRPRPVVVG